MDEKQQELMMKLSFYEQQMQNLQQQLQAVEKGIVELQGLNLGLDDLVGKKDNEIMAPVGRGIFVKAKLLDESLAVDIGNGNVVKKTIPETQDLLKEQVGKLEGIQQELTNALDQIGGEFQKMIEDFQNAQSGEKKN